MSKSYAIVHTMDTHGSVSVRVDTDRYVGSINDAPAMLSVGDRILLLLAREDAPVAGGHVELFARVVKVDNDTAGRSPLFAGLSFDAEIESWSDEVAAERTHIDSRIFRLPVPVVAQLDGYQSEADNSATDRDTEMTPFHSPSASGSAEVAPLPTEDEDLIEPSGVIGTLREVSLPEVVQSLELSRKTARIDIDQGSHRPRGRLFLKNGQVVHATLGDHVGEQAFFLLAEVTSGTYRIRFHRETDERTVEKPTGFLLLEALRIVDERHRPQHPVPVLEALGPAEEPAPFFLDDDDDPSHTNLMTTEIADVSRMTAEEDPFDPSIPSGFSLEEEMLEGLGEFDTIDANVDANVDAQAAREADPAAEPTVPGRLQRDDDEDIEEVATVEASMDGKPDIGEKPAPIRPAMAVKGPLSPADVSGPSPTPPPALPARAEARARPEGFEEVPTSVFSAFFEEASASGERSDEAAILDENAIMSARSDSYDSFPPL